MSGARHVLALARSLPFHSIGGMQAIAWDLLRELAHSGCEVTVLTTTIPGRSGSFEADGVHVVPIAGTTPERCNGVWWSQAREFATHELGSPPTVVLSVSSAGAALLPLRSLWRQTAFVFQAHGTSWGEFISKWRTGRPMQWAKSARNFYWMFKDIGIYKAFDRVVCVHDLFEQQFQQWPMSTLAAGVSRDVIRNGVDTALFKPDPAARRAVRQQLGWPDDARVAVFAARLHPQKGGSIAIQAFAQVARADARMLIIGDGPEEAALRALATSLGLDDRLHFAGSVVRENMPHWLAAGDSFVFPSLRAEGLTMSLLEALACGLRPVCSAGMESGIDRRLAIRFADPGNVDEMAARLSEALAEGAAGQSLLAPGYTLAECTASYIALFDRLRGI